MALALYRRYRPDTFDGVIGQKQVTEPLCRALDTGHLTHAYLFSGPRGCGKTSSARILARCANCAKGPTSHPCGECDSCRDLGRGGGGSLDVIEIDAASHNGVEDARDLRDKVAFGPTRDRYKIVILDEAHMVTASAFNALLKVVEEPPDNVMFIFATTEPDKVIGTIRSRTHHYPFRLVPPEVMGPYLEDVCHAEQVEPAPGVLRLVMRAGGGSVRDTLSVLDQLMAGAQDGAITYEQAVRLLGFTPDSLISGAVDAVIAGDGAALYGIVNKVAVGGYEPSKFVDDLLSRVRDLMILTLAGERAESTLSDSVRAEDMADLTRQAGALGLPRLSWMAETVNDALERMAGATSPRMRLELLAARLLAGPSPAPQAVPGAPAQDAAPREPGRSPRHARAEASPSSQRRSEADEIRDLSRDLSRIMADGTAPQGSAQPVASSGPAAPDASDSARPAPSSSTASDSVRPAASGNASFPSAAPDASDSAQPALPSDPVVSGPAQPAPSPPTASDSARPAPADAVTDRTWDALVAALPADARIHLDRSQVPRVALEENGTRGRLSLTFATPLAQLAFSLAMCEGRPVASLTVDAVHRAFGPHVGIAPTPQAANGETATPFKRMTPDEQRNARSDAAEYTRLLRNRAAMSGLAQPSASGSAEPADDASEGPAAPTPGPLPSDVTAALQDLSAPTDTGDTPSAPPVLPGNADSNAAPAESPAEPGQTAPVAPAPAANDTPSVASSPAAPAGSQAAARPAPHLPQSDAETDAMWDGLVANLPENARIYLTRAQVPQVKLQRSQKNPAKARLILKFATPLAQTAFSLASCGERPVSAVTTDAVHASFGDGIGIAPAAHAANGEQVTSFDKMSDEERQNARRQVIGYTLTLQNAQGVGAASALKTPRTPRQNGDTPTAPPAVGGDDAEADPWAGQESLAQVRAQEAREAGGKPHKKVAVPAADDTTDPWAGQQSLAERQAAARQTPAEAQPGAFRDAHPASPDDDAPAWPDGQPDANHGPIGALPATHPGTPHGQSGVAGGAQPFGGTSLAPSRRDAALAAAASPGAPHGIGTQAAPPQAVSSQGAIAVDEDGDEYSIDDSDLVTSLTIDEIARRLHATEVRDLSAADAA